tara:strand:- start:93 stop:1292 length:1200 start_codon:yes stop_codon:yes gene_type:complete
MFASSSSSASASVVALRARPSRGATARSKTFPRATTTRSRHTNTDDFEAFDATKDDDDDTDDDDARPAFFPSRTTTTTTTTTTSSRREFLNRASVVVAFVSTSAFEMSFPRSASATIGFQKELKPRRASLNDLTVHTSPTFQFRGEEHAGVQYGDTRIGNGKEIKAGSLTTIHFDVKLRGLTVLSTRTARTLGGNRTVSEPMQFLYGKLPTEFSKPLKRKTVNGIGAEVRIDPELGELYVVKVSPDGPAEKAGFKANDEILEIDGTKDLANLPIQEIGALLIGPVDTTVDVTVKKGGTRAGPDAPVEKYTLTREATAIVPKKRTANVDVEGGGGLFNGETGPAIPPVVYVPVALEGMKVGGRRIIKTPADLGYADQGEGEIPPGSEIIVEVEVLDVKDA